MGVKQRRLTVATGLSIVERLNRRVNRLATRRSLTFNQGNFSGVTAAPLGKRTQPQPQRTVDNKDVTYPEPEKIDDSPAPATPPSASAST